MRCPGPDRGRQAARCARPVARIARLAVHLRHSTNRRYCRSQRHVRRASRVSTFVTPASLATAGPFQSTTTTLSLPREIVYSQTIEGQIMRRCTHLVPSLKHAEVVDRKVGIRPYREEGVRLEWSGKHGDARTPASLAPTSRIS
jgi:hypothetical protein